jgi:hypothetical protein
MWWLREAYDTQIMEPTAFVQLDEADTALKIK